jgi:tape measure domain-containing protein
MASKQIQDIKIRLGIDGLEGLDKLKSSFRELEKSIGPSDATIQRARKSILDFGKEGQRTEQLIRGQIEAFKGLKSQAEISGDTFQALASDISNLERELKGSTPAIDRQRDSILRSTNAANQNAAAIQKQINQLTQLRNQTRPGSSVFVQLGKDIESATAKLGKFKSEAAAAAFALSQVPGTSLDKIANQIATINKKTGQLKITSDEYLESIRRIALLEQVRATTTGRQAVRAQTQLFESPLFETFVRTRAEQLPLPETSAGIQQRISEINQELANVTGYERRVDLTKELIDLNKRLKNTVIEITTKEELAAMAARQRLSAARESLGRSGFGAFSADVRAKTAEGQYDPGYVKAQEKARNRVIDEEAIKGVIRQYEIFENSYTRLEDLYERHVVEKAQMVASAARRENEILDEQGDKRIKQLDDQFKRELELFDQSLNQRDQLLQRRTAIKGTLGLGGRQLSSFYQGVVDIGTRRAAAGQQLMGKTPQQALADIVNTFNSDLDRTGNGFLEAEREMREAAIEFAGGSKKVRQKFEEIALGKTPTGMLPAPGEEASRYRERIEAPAASLIEIVKRFGRKTDKTGDGFLDAEKKIREAAINFAGGSEEVRRAFAQVPLGKTPTSMLPGAGEASGEYISRIRGGFGDFNLPDFSSFRKGTTRELQLVKQSLEELRLDLNPLAANFEATERRIIKSIKNIDRELGKRSAGRRGLSGMQLAQGVGAAISGGIFGGPEGLIGGLGGLAVGGVGGAFAGAAFGAQVGGLRQQLGGFAEYAAQIQKLEIALENTAGSQAEFNRAIKAASDVTKTLNVPQEVAISGMTRLSAAVKGAGGQISDAELVFKNVTAAIKGTGGAAQDVDGSVTALVQIFSKGKVSAEEINQIAERLPGTFNLIAEASGRTGPQLSKALEQGAVGLDDLMKFIVELGNRYSDVAQKIAASSQDAGARLNVAFNSMRQSVGDALQPIGAEFQEAFADFVENITPFLAENLPKIAGFVLDLSKNLVPLAGAIGGVSAALAILKVQALLASGGMTALASAIGAANAVALVNPYVALAAGVGLLAAKLIGAVNKQRELNNLIKGQGTLEQFNNRYQEIEGQITAAQEKLTEQTGRQAQATRNRINQLKSSLSDLEKVRGKFEQAVPEQEKITPSDFPDPTGKDSGSGRAKKERESQLPQLLAELAAAQEIARVNEKIREAQLQGNQFLQIRLEGEKELARIAGEIRAIAFEKIPADEAEVKKKLLLLKFDESRLDTLQRLRQLEKENTKELTSGLDEVAKKYKEQREKGSAVAEMVKKGITPALAEAYYEIDKTYQKEKERIQLKIEEQRLAIAGLDVESKVRKEIEKQIENLEKLLKLRGQKVPEAKEDAAAEEERKRREKEAEEKAQRLKNLYGGIVSTIEDGIVGSFTAGIESLIEGTKTLGQALQEIASGVLKDIGQLLLRFGVNAGLRAVFPGAFAEKGAYFASGQASFAKNSIQPFAMGGIVTKPTFFKYADGGTFNNGVMGEAGPEAIMPLKRGLDGKLGVAARLDGALKRYRPVPGSAAAVAEGAELTTGSSAAGATAIDVRYNVERINNVDYVTNQEFQAGLQQAATQGAERGQQLALRRLQQSVTTRRRLGI